MKIIVFIFIFLLSACSSAQIATDAAQPKASDYQVGEKWVWKYRGVTDQGIVRADGIDTKQVIKDNGELKLSDGKNNVLVADITKPDLNPTPRYQWPLSVGKSWIFAESWTSQDGTTGKSTQNAEIISYQKETVAAGTFMAFTIRYKGNITNSRGYNAETEEVFVYAPEVKNFIKLTQKQGDYYYVEELIEYSKPR